MSAHECGNSREKREPMLAKVHEFVDTAPLFDSSNMRVAEKLIPTKEARA
jgi:hypothetical protein